MANPGSVVSQLLSNLGADRRRSTNTYVNATARRGDGTPRRVLSDVGFLQSTQVTFVNTSRMHVTFNDTEERRAIENLVLVGYGLSDDYKRLVSSRPEDRLVRHNASVLRGGVEHHPDDSGLVMNGDLDAQTSDVTKTQKVVRAMTTDAGPAPHFIVTRKGDLIIGPSIDGETTVVSELRAKAVFIAIESMLVMGKADHAARRFDRIFEAPLTGRQAVTLATLVNKLRVALGTTVPRTFGSPGLSYRRSIAMADVQETLFQTTKPNLALPGVTLDFSFTTQNSFFELVDAQGSYDLATQVWQNPNTPPIRTGRQEARTAIGQVDTAAAESAYMGAYATIAGEERSDDMQRQVRSQMFVSRHRAGHTESTEILTNAGHVAEVGGAALLPEEVPANAGPHTYDFTTGLWGDNKAV